VLCEALNIAVLWKLPVIFVCENNGFSEFSPSDTVTSGRIVDRAKPYGAASEEVDGNDLIAVHQCASRAIARARTGEGPTLIEARTYRLHGHVEAEATFLSSSYRTDEEIEDWRKRDPISLFSKRLLDAGIADEAALNMIDANVQNEVEAAVTFAEGSDWPTLDQATRHMFA